MKKGFVSTKRIARKSYSRSEEAYDNTSDKSGSLRSIESSSLYIDLVSNKRSATSRLPKLSGTGPLFAPTNGRFCFGFRGAFACRFPLSGTGAEGRLKLDSDARPSA